MTPIAEVLKPYTLYLIYGQILLLSLAIFVGAMLIIRRLWKKESVDGGLIQDREKLAAEIHEEVLRLQDLRNRLDSSYIIEGKDISASPVASVLIASTEASPAATDNALSQIALEEKVQEATQALTGEIAELTQKLARSEEKLKAVQSAPASSSAPVAAVTDAVPQAAMTEIRELKEKLEDYQAFEDDIALVKQYKEEIERLKALLAAGGVTAAPADRISEDDIASLFAEMGSSTTEEETAPEATPEAAEENDPFAALMAQEPSPPSEPEPVQVFAASKEAPPPEDMVFAADPTDAPELKGYVAEAQKNEPVLSGVNEDNAEALAELGEDDQLMAEFEKVLGTKGSEKNT